MIRRPPRSTLDRSSAASDVYKRQITGSETERAMTAAFSTISVMVVRPKSGKPSEAAAVSYTHLRAHETVLDLVCRLLLEKKKKH